MKEYFQKHFTAKEIEKDSIEFDTTPDILDNLQNISVENMKTGPPDESEFKTVISNCI